MDYKQTLEYLFSQLPMFQRVGVAAYKANLDNTHAILELLGSPHKNFRSLHIAGTNGKGSVSHMTASVLQQKGLKTGLYTSPHLKSFRERIKINGEMISKKYVISFVEKFKKEFEKIKPSFFEMTVGMAFKYFEESKVDIAVIEVGMGGRLDSTNVISPELSIITNIGFDHTQFLGNTLEKIAKEKAEIIKPETPVVIGEYQEEIANIFTNKAKACNSEIYFSDQNIAFQSINESSSRNKKAWQVSLNNSGNPFIENISLPLTGLYQLKNLITTLQSIEVLNYMGFGLSVQHIKAGIENVIKSTGIRGRWETLSVKPLVICDIGHNLEGMQNILSQIKTISFEKLHFVLGMVNDKQIDNILKLLPKHAAYYFCKANIPRGLGQKKLLEKASGHGLKGQSYESVKSALETAKQNSKANDLIFVGGSTFVVAEVL